MAPLPILRILAQLWGVVGSVVTRAAVEAYSVHAARNVSAGVVGGRQVSTRTMEIREALDILNVQAKNPKRLTSQEVQQAEEHYKKYFEANTPEKDGPGGSAYLQGKIIAAYQHIRDSANKA